MKLKLTLEVACDLHNNLTMMQDAPGFVQVHSHLVQVSRRIAGAIERSGRFVKIEGGWQGPKTDFGKTVEFAATRSEVLAIYASLLFMAQKMGAEAPSLMEECIDALSTKLVDLGEDHKVIAREAVGMFRAS